MTSLEVRGVGVRLGRASVLADVSLRVPEGAWTAVLGPNGAGKSTLLRCIAAVLRHEGQVLVDGRDVAALAPRERARLIAYAPQVPVIPDGISVAEYVMLGRVAHHPLLSAPGAGDRDVVAHALERLDLTALAGRRMGQVSGGERHRAVLARSLAQEARLLLLDEPTASLDLGHAQALLDLVDGLRRSEGLTVLSTLHDLTLAGQYADDLVLLAGGRVVAAGAPAEVLTAERLAEHFGARATVSAGPDGVRVVPVRGRA